MKAKPLFLRRLFAALFCTIATRRARTRRVTKARPRTIMAPPKVAVCFAGAWRDWPGAWRHIQPNIIESLGDVDIFAVSDSIPAGAHGMGDVSFTVARMREAFGARFKGGEHLSARHLENVSAHTWPSITATQAALPKHSTVFAYLYKIWRCGQLIHKSGVMYDVIVRLRPDLWPTQPFHILRIGRGDGAVYELQVGGRCVQFGSRTVVIHAYTNFCANDWLAIGSAKAMTVTMDLLRFWSPASRFLSPDEAMDSLFSKSVELAHNWLWWRTGTAVVRQPLFIELARRRCSRPNCLRMPAWQIMREQQQQQQQQPGEQEPQRPHELGMAALAGPSVLNDTFAAGTCIVHAAAPRPSIGTMQPGRHGLVNDCGDADGSIQDLEWFTGPIPASSTSRTAADMALASQPVVSRSARGRAKRAKGFIEPPRVLPISEDKLAWTRPACTDVEDLSVMDPLVPCKKLSGDELSYKPLAHRPSVLRGYGVPLCFQCDGSSLPSRSKEAGSLPTGGPLENAMLTAARAGYQAVVEELEHISVSPEGARAHVGDVARLRWTLGRCLNPLHTPGSPRPDVRVLVVGCSMTQGFMNCGTTLAGKQCSVPCDSLSWYRVLGGLLQQALPGCTVVALRSTSRGGRSVTTAQRYDTRVRRFQPHVILTDLTVCDLRGITSSLDEVRVQAGMETLIRRALADASFPALIHVESWSELNPMGKCKNVSAHRVHLPVAAHYNVPTLSFMLGVCAVAPERALRRHWRGGCSANASTCQALDTEGQECEPHPGPHTHRVFALLAAELMLAEAVRAGVLLASAKARSGLPRPVPLDESATRTLLPSAALSSLAACRAHHGTGTPLETLDFAEGACGTPTRGEGWRCYADRPGKPGWIREVSDELAGTGLGDDPPLSFSVPLATSKLTVGFLRSYDARMGTARVWLDDDVDSAVLLNGSWASQTSQTDLAVVRAAELCRRTCLSKPRNARHQVHVQRVSGQKFKLLSIELC